MECAGSLLLKKLSQEETEVNFWEQMDCYMCRLCRMWTARTGSGEGTGVDLGQFEL